MQSLFILYPPRRVTRSTLEERPTALGLRLVILSRKVAQQSSMQMEREFLDEIQVKKDDFSEQNNSATHRALVWVGLWMKIRKNGL